jgi:peptide/nickel transport system substrate-binding protein
MTLGRRAFLLSALSASAFELDTERASALGRTPLGGTLRLALPFVGSELDPHAVSDPLSALFGHAIADPLYALDGDGKPYPALAAAMPRATEAGTRVMLRQGLVTARGKSLDEKDVLFSLARAREQGGAAVLAELPRPVKDGNASRSIVFPGTTPDAVATALSSPLTALVPRGFRPATPDGTGAFRASSGTRGWVLERNVSAARGPAFLARIEVALGGDLAEALRAFEADRVDLGWLGAGLHRARAGAVSFEGPVYGWVLLRAGREAGRWSAPGVAQELLDRVPREPLRHLGLVAPTGAARPGAAWGGGNVELFTLANAPQLEELATRVAAAFSVDGQRVSVRALTSRELSERRTSGRYALMLDFVRPAGAPGRATLLSLLAAADPALAARPPLAPSYQPTDLARTLPLGVLGSLRVAGAHLPSFRGLASWQLGNVHRSPTP